MRWSLLAGVLLLFVIPAQARHLGFGADAFNRVVPVSVSGGAAFSPLSFEIDSVLFAEAVDPIRRSQFSDVLHVMDEFATEYRPLARMPFESPGTNGVLISWVHALVVDDPRRIDPAFRLTVQDLYGAEVCGAHRAQGIEAWVRTRFEGDFDDWRLSEKPGRDAYSLQDIVSVAVQMAPTNGWKRVYQTHAVYRLPLLGGAELYAIVPKQGRWISSVRTKLTSVTLPEMLAMNSAVADPPMPVRLSVPAVDFVSTNDLAGAFSYFRFSTMALKPFPPGFRPASLRQTVRFRLHGTPAEFADEILEGPFLFFVHDPVAQTLPVIGIVPGKVDRP